MFIITVCRFRASFNFIFALQYLIQLDQKHASCCLIRSKVKYYPKLSSGWKERSMDYYCFIHRKSVSILYSAWRLASTRMSEPKDCHEHQRYKASVRLATGEKSSRCPTTWSIDLCASDIANSFIAIQCDVNKSSFGSGLVFLTDVGRSGLLRSNGMAWSAPGEWWSEWWIDMRIPRNRVAVHPLQLTICPLNNSITPADRGYMHFC